MRGFNILISHSAYRSSAPKLVPEIENYFFNLVKLNVNICRKPGQEPADVLNDIGNMLANLTDELDAMLEEEKRQGLTDD